ncbi:hypothetical protein [Microbacterium pygmaeum]|uniref:Uncharacterized protein n=1 Tax=Microbacterium pygmaeum TaxID=370764 RepID=A0A1G8E050_9MICO|nr:hypothetical protein [Microbacterium pygmaeum]SDH63346.1 hypothetical protein SAMN04489810_3498 [Microbacterium pygmaeum]
MTDLESRPESTPSKTFSRRSVMKTAAWSVPVIAATAAMPLAAASVSNANLTWTGITGSLLSLRVLDSATVVTAALAPTLPTQLTLTNGAGAIANQSASVSIVVDRPGGINITVGRARGFGVYSFNGAPTPAGSRTSTYQIVGFPRTTYTTTTTVNVASNGTFSIPVVWGLAGTNTGINISALANFPVTATVVVGGRTLTATSTISVPVGAGLL